MRNFLINVLQQNRERKNLKSFHNMEDKVISIIGEIEKKHTSFSESLENEANLSGEINNLQVENQTIKIKDASLDKIIERKRLKFMKWFAIFIEALLSYNAINLFLKETIGLSLASGSEEANGIATMAKSMLVAVPVAGLLLIGALYFKHNDETKYADKKGIKSYWYKFSWILSILIVPFLNIFIVLNHPEHNTNLIWIFFSIVTFLINIKLVNYSTQFHQMQVDELKEKQLKPIEKQIKNETTKREALRKKVQIIFNNLAKPANDLKRAYESFGNSKPVLSLNPIYCLFLNTYIYYSQVLPVEGYSLTLPPSDFSNYFDFLNATISQRKNLKKEINDKVISNNDGPIEDEPADNNLEGTNGDTNNDTEIPDNEIYL